MVHAADVETLTAWRPGRAAEAEIPFMPSRVILQDLTGVPAVVDLAVMRDAMADLGGDPALVNPLVPADLVIDHSVQVDRFGSEGAFAYNVEREYERNIERYQLLRWAQTAFRTCGSCRRGPASSTRSTSSSSPPSSPSGRTRMARLPSPTRWSAPTRTRR